MAADTVAIIEAGGYPVDGRQIPVPRPGKPTLYLPEDELPALPTATGHPVIEVTAESTLAAARRLADRDPAVLNFASAKKPGGGFRSGAEAQEESLARSSSLIASLDQVPEFYDFHRRLPGQLYTSRVIYSPAVPVFRDDDARLLPAPYLTTFLTCAAPNVNGIQPPADIQQLLATRAHRVLQVAAAHGHHTLVLGAWGCGVFRNDPRHVAQAFRDALPDFAFQHVTFAILGSPETRTAFEVTLRP
ncbi:TIGR02452 family protein [Pseudonocardiaceae bacterium YIM PH 21723]|nr:TIGR02452 family protein [Pseudonocardiaceae bacterium YIM PH 21723]